MSCEKPKFPSNVSSWWKKPAKELTQDQLEIRRAYYREYSAWRNSQKSGPRRVRSAKKLPQGVSEWWNLPMSELTPEQQEIKRNYNKKYYKEYMEDQNVQEKRKVYRKEYYQENCEELRTINRKNQRLIREQAKEYLKMTSENS